MDPRWGPRTFGRAAPDAVSALMPPAGPQDRTSVITPPDKGGGGPPPRRFPALSAGVGPVGPSFWGPWSASHSDVRAAAVEQIRTERPCASPQQNPTHG